MARTPLYQKAELEMRRRIADGDWPIGMRLGNEFQLADEFGVSQGTMRRALMTLESDGLLNRKPGRGTVVADATARPPSGKTAHLLGPDGNEPNFDVHRAKRTKRSPDAQEAALFGQTQVHYLERLLKLGTNRVALEEMVVTTGATPEFDETSSADLGRALADHGIAPASIEERVSAGMTSMSDSVALSCDRNTPLLCVTRVARDDDGQVIARQVLRIAEPGFSYA